MDDSQTNSAFDAAFAPTPQAPAPTPVALPQADAPPVNVFTPEGDLQSIDRGHLQTALGQGYREASPDEVDSHFQQEKYGTGVEQAKTALEGAGEAATFGLSSGIEKAFGVKDEDIRGRRAANPGVHALGQVGGLAATSLIPGLGEANAAKVMEATGLAAAKSLGLGAEGASLLSRVGAKSVSEATQMALFQGGDELSKLITNDPEQSVGSAAADVGLAGLIGGGVGAGLGVVSPLWKATVGDTVGKTMADFKGRMDFHLKNPDPVTAVHEELGAYYNAMRSAADEVYGATGLKSQEIAKLMPEMSPEIQAHSNDLFGKARGLIDKMKADPESYSTAMVKRLDRIVTKAEGTLNPSLSPSEQLMGVKMPETTAAAHFDELNSLKQEVQEMSKFGKRVTPGSAEAQVINEVKGLGFDLRKGLEDAGIWGKAGERQQSINKAFSEYLPTLKDFERKFTSEIGGEKILDQGKVQTYMNQLDKASGSLKKSMLGNFLDASEKYRKVIGATQANLGLDQIIPHTPLNVTRGTMEDVTSGARLADYVVRKGLANVAGEGAGAALGAGISSAVGIPPGWGALAGQHALGPLFAKVLPALTRPILDSATNSSGIKAAVDYTSAVAKGENALGKAVKNVFKNIEKPAINLSLPSERSRDKLNAQVINSQTNPSSLLHVGGDTGHYLPKHATALSATAMNALAFLNSQRPDTTPKMPLDSKLPPDPGKKANYNRMLDIANQPLLVVDKIKSGSITPNEIIAVKTMYPGLYNNLVGKLTNEMNDHMTKGGAIPYTTRLGLSLFAGTPLDSTMTPQAIVSAQPKPVQQPQQGQTKPPSASSTKGISKLPGQYQTANQTREQRAQKS